MLGVLNKLGCSDVVLLKKSLPAGNLIMLEALCRYTKLEKMSLTTFV